jgi:DNA-binding transcriptional ArsR family regulator
MLHECQGQEPYRGDMPDDQAQAGEVVLEDLRALRALAHPARTAIIDDLYQGNVRTASELATIVGLTPSATSYHLRALERWGILERAGSSQDGRERPWRAPGKVLRWGGDVAAGAGTSGVYDAIAGEYLVRLREQLDAWARAPRAEREAWPGASALTRGYLWLDPQEAQDLAAEILALVDRAGRDRDARHHPPGTRRFALVAALVPVVESQPAQPPPPSTD